MAFCHAGCKKQHPSRQKPSLTSLDITRIMSPCPRALCVLLLAPHNLSVGGVASLHQKRIKALFDNTRPPPHVLSVLSGTAKSRGTRRSDGRKNRGNSGRKVPPDTARKDAATGSMGRKSRYGESGRAGCGTDHQTAGHRCRGTGGETRRTTFIRARQGTIWMFGGTRAAGLSAHFTNKGMNKKRRVYVRVLGDGG